MNVNWLEVLIIHCNRIVSDSGVAGRFPFLDEDVVNYLASGRE